MPGVRLRSQRSGPLTPSSSFPPSPFLFFAGTETEEALQKRLANAGKEISSASSMWWDSWVVNDDLDRSYAQLKAAIGK
jgi:guanylate kinase